MTEPAPAQEAQAPAAPQTEEPGDEPRYRSQERPAGPLVGRQRRHLRGLAHAMKPLAMVGKNGVTDAFLADLDHTLRHHELVKVKFLDFKEEKKALGELIADRLGCAIAGRVGHHVLLYRPASDPEDRQIRLPG
ncbi:MAG: YhbY family RNA-binding protein [Acidobacteriota bacterium]